MQKVNSNIPSIPTMDAVLKDPKYKDFFVSLYGQEEYDALKNLDEEARNLKTRKKSKKTVFVLHGITGSTLGDPDQILDPFDIIWIGPTRIIGGDLKHLKYPVSDLSFVRTLTLLNTLMIGVSP